MNSESNKSPTRVTFGGYVYVLEIHSYIYLDSSSGNIIFVPHKGLHFFSWKMLGLIIIYKPHEQLSR
jgi:hypothetical protein